MGRRQGRETESRPEGLSFGPPRTPSLISLKARRKIDGGRGISMSMIERGFVALALAGFVIAVAGILVLTAL